MPEHLELAGRAVGKFDGIEIQAHDAAREDAFGRYEGHGRREEVGNRAAEAAPFVMYDPREAA